MTNQRMKTENCKNCHLSNNYCVVIDDLVLNTTQFAGIQELASIATFYLNETPDEIVEIILNALKDYQTKYNKLACNFFHYLPEARTIMAEEIFERVANTFLALGYSVTDIKKCMKLIVDYWDKNYNISITEYIQSAA